jgi:hypothetical protein
MHLEHAPFPSKPLALVVAAGLIAATLDIAFAVLYWAVTSGTPASRIFQSVAAGVLGAASFDGGAATATLGLALHFLIVIIMAAAYYGAARRWSALRERPFVLGGAYGVLLYAVMRYLVVPLSRANAAPDDPLWAALGLAAHVFLVGIPIALAAGRAAVLHR